MTADDDGLRAEGDAERTDYRRYAVSMTNKSAGSVHGDSSRWEIENGSGSIERFMAATTPRSFVLRCSCFAVACLLRSTWRGVDSLIQVELITEYERSPAVTANALLTRLLVDRGLDRTSRRPSARPSVSASAVSTATDGRLSVGDLERSPVRGTSSPLSPPHTPPQI